EHLPNVETIARLVLYLQRLQIEEQKQFLENLQKSIYEYTKVPIIFPHLDGKTKAGIFTFFSIMNYKKNTNLELRVPRPLQHMIAKKIIFNEDGFISLLKIIPNEQLIKIIEDAIPARKFKHAVITELVPKQSCCQIF
ncbi:MAG: hypothetical protein HYX60_09945, partial [Legionella longbeachae]|nr:hypothetical protein [Legionella longbeachae]